MDPLSPQYPWYTPYQFAGNKPIWAIDLDGLEEFYSTEGAYLGQIGKSTEIRIINAHSYGLGTSGGNTNHQILNSQSFKAFTSSDQAAVEWGFEYNGKTHKNNAEYGAVIGSRDITLKNGNKTTLFILGSTVTDGQRASVAVDNSVTPEGWNRSHSIHSHPPNYHWTYGDEKVDAENFSEKRKDDVLYHWHAIRMDIENVIHKKRVSYLATPDGSLKKFDYRDASKPRDERISVLPVRLPFYNVGNYKDTVPTGKYTPLSMGKSGGQEIMNYKIKGSFKSGQSLKISENSDGAIKVGIVKYTPPTL